MAAKGFAGIGVDAVKHGSAPLYVGFILGRLKISKFKSFHIVLIICNNTITTKPL